jgi:hypothetical protein
MNHPIDDERWAPDREVIEREKKAARTWLARRDWSAAGIGRKTPPLRRPARPARWAAAAATGIAVLFLGFLLLRPVFHSGSTGGYGTSESIRKVFENVQSEGPASLPVVALLSEAAASETAWSIQRVFCAITLEDATEGGIPRLIESALEKLGKIDEVRPESPGRKEPRRSHISEIFLRVYRSIKEG